MRRPYGNIRLFATAAVAEVKLFGQKIFRFPVSGLQLP
jgi:hypothetical protein